MASRGAITGPSTSDTSLFSTSSLTSPPLAMSSASAERSSALSISSSSTSTPPSHFSVAPSPPHRRHHHHPIILLLLLQAVAVQGITTQPPSPTTSTSSRLLSLLVTLYRDDQKINSSYINTATLALGSTLVDTYGWVTTLSPGESACDINSTFPEPEGGPGANPSLVPSVALVMPGDCGIDTPINSARKSLKRLVMVVFAWPDQDRLNITLPEPSSVDPPLVVAIPQSRAARLAAFSASGLDVRLQPLGLDGAGGPGSGGADGDPGFNSLSLMFLSVSVVLVLISLTWFLFYYTQRYRAINANSRRQRQLMTNTKKAIAKLEAKNVKPGDKEVGAEFDACAVCIEGYKVGEVVRILPCKHEFHRVCVDPWLLQHRTCPMCKLDILKGLGIAEPEEPPERVPPTRNATAQPANRHAAEAPQPANQESTSDTAMTEIDLGPPLEVTTPGSEVAAPQV